MDFISADPSSIREFPQCLHIALLCVQEHPEDRPNMTEVVSMLTNESSNLPLPKQPAFSSHVGYRGSQEQPDCSSIEITYSMVDAR